jgi:hypothetical protein
MRLALLVRAIFIYVLAVAPATTAEDASTCAKISDLEKCAEGSCFPHYAKNRHTCVDAEPVDCKIQDDHTTANTLALLVSDGLSNNDLRNAFRQLVLQLPSAAWEGDSGATQKKEASARNVAKLAAKNFREPSLYKGLSALLISDACYLKRFEKDPWPCESYKSTLLNLGFEAANVKEVDLFEVITANLDHREAQEYAHINDDLRKLLDPTNAKGKLANMASLRSYVARKGAWKPLVELFNSVDVIGVSGGSPDFLEFAMSISPFVKEHIRKEVGEGRIVYTGRSAGAMVAGVDSALTTEMIPRLWEHLGVNRHGLGLVGSCAIRPHYNAKTWDKASEIYEEGLDINVVRMPNGEGLMCKGKECKMVGMEHDVKWHSDKQAPPTITVHEEKTTPHQQGHSAFPSDDSYKFRNDLTLDHKLRASLPENPSFGSKNPKCRLCYLQVATGSHSDDKGWIDSGCEAACASHKETAAPDKLFSISDRQGSPERSSTQLLLLAACAFPTLLTLGIILRAVAQRRENRTAAYNLQSMQIR